MLEYYKGREIRRWGRQQHNWASILPNLVHIELFYCDWLRHLPVVSRLQHLKKLELYHLGSVEYMEEDEEKTSGDSASSHLPFFPALEYLDITGLKKLQGWWRRRVGSNDNLWQPPSFPSLSTLLIKKCPNLVSFPYCPTVETLKLVDVNERLRSSTTTTTTSVKSELLQLREVRVDHMAHLKALPPCCPHHICIEYASMESFSGQEEEEVFSTSNFSSLQSLAIEYCLGLESLPRGMQYLTSLQHLTIQHCFNLEAIPEWISCLSSLQSLCIHFCKKIKSMPEAMRNITSLHRLDIEDCSDDPDGEDWPKIKHVPYISIRSW